MKRLGYGKLQENTTDKPGMPWGMGGSAEDTFLLGTDSGYGVYTLSEMLMDKYKMLHMLPLM